MYACMYVCKEDSNMQIALKFFSLCILHIYMARSITTHVNFLFSLSLSFLIRIGFLRYYIVITYIHTYIKKNSIQ